MCSCHIPSYECSTLWCVLLSPQVASPRLIHCTTCHRGSRNCTHGIWTWCSRHIYFGGSSLHCPTVHDTYLLQHKLELNQRNTSVIMPWLKGIRKGMLMTIKARCSLTHLRPMFCKEFIFDQLDSWNKTIKQYQYGHWGNKHRNTCKNWQPGLVVSKYMTIYNSQEKCPFWG